MEPGKKEESEVSGKRDFLKIILGGSLVMWLGSVLYPILAYLKPPVQAEVEVTSVRVGSISDVENDSGMIVRFGNKPVILVRLPGGEFRAFEATCTHLDCTVQYRKDLQMIWCACHNGRYDLTGRNIAGPPPRPLTQFRVVVKNDELFVARATET
jgi:Rieske Fe-S protein